MFYSHPWLYYLKNMQPLLGSLQMLKTQIGVYVLRLDLSCIVMCIKPKVLHKDPKFCSYKR